MPQQIINPFGIPELSNYHPITITNPIISGSWGGTNPNHTPFSDVSAIAAMNPVQDALDKLNPIKQVESYLQKNQINYIVGFIGIVLLIVGIFTIAQPAISSAVATAAKVTT